jgi:pRiA4b ORF-3-like protein
MVYKFRVILDTEEDIFRDIAILEDDTLEDLHNAIVNAFDFDGREIASFYTCDDKWNQEEEISLFDTGDVPGEQKVMGDYLLSEILNADNTKIIYVYDFLNMWTFLVELAAIEEVLAGETYPSMLFTHGIMPMDAADNNLEADMNDDIYGEFEDDLDQDDLDMFEENEGESFEDYGFEENWN